MVQYNNPAGRIYDVLKKIMEHRGQQPNNAQQLANLIGCRDDWGSILRAVTDLRSEYNELLTVITQFQDKPEKYSLYREHLDAIQKSVDGFVLSVQNNTFSASVSPEAVVALRFIAADLPQEVRIPADEIEQLRKLCEELRREIEGSDLPKTLKAWLLDLVRLMRDGIDRYKIRGSRGLRSQFHEMLGSMMTHYADVEEVKEKALNIWEKIKTGYEFMCKFSENVEKGQKMIEGVSKFIERVWPTGSPPMLGQ